MRTRVGVAAELAFALELADRADAISLRHFRSATLLVESKSDRSPVSEADREIERMIRHQIEATRPEHAILGEEYGPRGGSFVVPPQDDMTNTLQDDVATSLQDDVGSSLRWIIDPIDGTRKFVRGMPGFATLIALEQAGEIVVGVASAPALGRRWWAGRGLGAFSDGLPIHVSLVSTLAEAHIAHGSLEGWQRAGKLTQLGNLAAQSWGASGYGDFWIHALVAEGAAEAGLEIEGAIWDFAALKIIVEEAGGRFTDLDGADTADGGSGFSSNGQLHDTVLALLK